LTLYAILALAFSTVLIFIRCTFRVAELSKGFGSALANNEVTFMVLEGAMVATAVIFLTLLSPGVAFGQVAWDNSGWTLSGKPKTKIPHVKSASSA
jgi:hypothetical protein